jgi:hypothetical protein
MDIAGILGNVVSGGVFGLLGTGLSALVSYFQAKQQHEFRLAETAQQMELMKLQAQTAAAQTAGEVAVTREAGAATAFTASIQAEQSVSATYPWVNAVRALVRPALTLLALLLTATFYFFPPVMPTELQQFVVQNVGTMAFAAFTWWFGQRAIDKSALSWGNTVANASVQSSSPTK